MSLKNSNIFFRKNIISYSTSALLLLSITSPSYLLANIDNQVSKINNIINNNYVSKNFNKKSEIGKTISTIKKTSDKLSKGKTVKGKISRDIKQVFNKSADTPSAKDISNFTKSYNKVILFVWDGLRPDVITKENTPNLYSLKQQGVFFSDHHSSYPSVTMNNANSIATGNYSGGTGFYGNSVWRPDVAEKTGKNKGFKQPVFTQNHKILQDLDQSKYGKPLLYVNTLIQIAREYGLKTAQVGKAGPVALQDAHKPAKNGIIVTDGKLYPLDFAKKLQKKGYNLPQNAVDLYNKEELSVSKKNIDPTKKVPFLEVKTIDGSIPLIGLSNPHDATDAVAKEANEYLMDVYLKEILPDFGPDFSIIWLREPDSTSHKYGVGTKAFYQALANQDKLFGKLKLYIDKLGIAKNTNIMVVSDHGHSNVSADQNLYPLREIKNSSIGDLNQNGYSVSGNVRVADLLTKAGFKAFDGGGCNYNPIMSGMLADRKLLQSIKVDQKGDICNEGPGRLYTTKSYVVPQELPDDAVIVANNGGSAYIYIPDQDEELVTKVVRFLQSRQEFDSIFVDDIYGDIPGTLSLRKVKFYDPQQERHSDILVSMSYDDKQVVQGLPGTIYTSSNITRGSHGSLSPIDIKNVFIASGPNFRSNYVDKLPTANVDVPLTMAYILNLPFKGRTGRLALEALKGSGVKASDYELKYRQIQPEKPATKLKIQSLTNIDGKEVLQDKDSYTFVLNTKQLYYKGEKYNYIDSGKAIRY